MALNVGHQRRLEHGQAIEPIDLPNRSHGASVSFSSPATVDCLDLV